jgi:hypothetical protein
VVEPEYRRSLVRAIADHLEAQGIAQEVLRFMPAASREALASDERAGWVPSTMIIDVDHALVSALGEGGLVEFWRRFSGRARHIPLLGAMAEGLTRVFAGPHGVLKLMPRSFAAVGRGNGVVTARIDEDRLAGELRYEALPPCLRYRAFVLANEGSLAGAFEMTQAAPAIASDQSELAQGRFTIRATWRPEDLGPEVEQTG